MKVPRFCLTLLDFLIFLKIFAQDCRGSVTGLLVLKMQHYIGTLFYKIKFILVITRLGGQFGINCPSTFLKSFQKFSKITFSNNPRVIYPRNCPKQTCVYWLITPTQEALCIETNIFYPWAITNHRAGS